MRTTLLAMLLWFAALVGNAPLAQAFDIWDYLSHYQIGVDKAWSTEQLQLSYKAPSASATSCPDGQCTVGLDAGRASGWGVFFSHGFERQGLFYADGGLALALHTFAATLPQPATTSTPLRSFAAHLYGLRLAPYVRVGITPDNHWPDVFLSLGPEVQFFGGTVAVDGQARHVTLASRSGLRGFTELEVVPWRFGKGALSFFLSSDVSGQSQFGGLFTGVVDGMSAFAAHFQTRGGGIRLLFNVP